MVGQVEAVSGRNSSFSDFVAKCLRVYRCRQSLTPFVKFARPFTEHPALSQDFCKQRQLRSAKLTFCEVPGHDSMRLKHPRWCIRAQYSTKPIAIVAIFVLGLLGGLFHHHESARDADACSYCHAGAQAPPIDPATALVAPFLAAVGSVTPTRTSALSRNVQLSTLVPRAPPITTHFLVFWEGCIRVVY